MNILVMGIDYAPEKTGIGPFTTDLCIYLAQQGHKITVVTAFPHYPEWRIHDGYRGKLFLRERMEGIRICRSYVYVPGKPSPVQRIIYDISFSLSAFVSGLLPKKVDVILCISTPLELGVTAWMLARLKGSPFLFHIQDLIPDTAVDLGMLRNKRAISLAHRLEGFVYKKATAIGVISSGFAENLYSKGVPKYKVHYLPNWIDTDFVKPMDRDNTFRRQNDIAERDVLVMYAGNLGNKQGLEVLTDAASLLREHEDICFLIVGEGVRKTYLIDKAGRLKLRNLRFLPLQPKAMLPWMLSGADILVLTQQAGVTDMCFPCKLLTNMASATPLVAAVNTQSETAKAIQAARSGFVVEPENPEALAQAILQLRASPSLRQQLGDSGRAYVSEHFEKREVLQRFEEVLVQMA